MKTAVLEDDIDCDSGGIWESQDVSFASSSEKRIVGDPKSDHRSPRYKT